jgi:hypothetical protein
MSDTRSDTGGRGQPSTANTGTVDPNQLAEDFGELARSLEEHDDPGSLLAEIVAAAVAMVPGADEGSISVVTARSRVGSQARSRRFESCCSHPIETASDRSRQWSA